MPECVDPAYVFNIGACAQARIDRQNAMDAFALLW